MFVDFQIIGDVFALRTVTKDESIRWMIKPEVFHMGLPDIVRDGGLVKRES
jgi:hypothetical protein